MRSATKYVIGEGVITKSVTALHQRFVEVQIPQTCEVHCLHRITFNPMRSSWTINHKQFPRPCTCDDVHQLSKDSYSHVLYSTSVYMHSRTVNSTQRCPECEIGASFACGFQGRLKRTGERSSLFIDVVKHSKRMTIYTTEPSAGERIVCIIYSTKLEPIKFPNLQPFLVPFM